MKILFKIVTVVLIVIALPISIYYGFRYFDEPMYYEFNNRSYVVTLPNRVWFEINTSLDQLGKDSNPGELVRPLEDSRPNIVGEGLNIGLSYPKMRSTIEAKGVYKEQLFTREANTLTVDQTITLTNLIVDDYDFYIVNIFFSQFGSYDSKTNTYSQEGCDVQVVSKKGDIHYIEQEARIYIEYEIENEVSDLIKLNITCFENDK